MGALGSPKRLLRGVNMNRFYCAENYVKEALLHANLQLQGILILCDPIDRLDRMVFEGYWKSLDNVKSHPDNISAANLLNNTDQFRDNGPGLYKKLAEIRTFFGSRLLVLHQEALRMTPRATYNLIARFLGVGDFPAGARFDVVNAMK